MLMTRKFCIFAPLALTLAIASGCQKEQPQKAPAAPPKAPAPTPAPKAADVTADVRVNPPSPLADARDTLKVYDFGDQTLSTLDSLRHYVIEYPKAEDAAEAAKLAARTELDVLVRAVHSKDPELAVKLAKTLEGQATDTASAAAVVTADIKKLFAAVGWPEAADQALASAAEDGLAVAGAVAGVEGGEGEVDVDRFLTALNGTGPFAGAARYYAASKLLQAFASLEELRHDQIPEAFAVPSARLLCASCEGAARESGGDVTPALLAGEPGVACPAIREKMDKLSPAAAWALLAAECDPASYGLSSKEQLTQMAGPNFLPMRAYGMLSLLVAAPEIENDPMARLISQLVAPATGEGKHTSLASALGIPYEPPAATEAEAEALTVAPVEQPGPSWARGGLATVVVDKTTVRAALRPVVTLEGGKVTIAGSGAALAFPGKEVVTLEALLAKPEEGAPAETEHPGMTKLVAGLEALGQVASEIETKYEDVAGERLAGTEGDEKPVSSTWLVVDAASRTEALASVVAGVVKAGYQRARVLTGVGMDAFVPVALGALESIPADALDIRHKRPVLVVLTADGADVFPPKGSLGSARGNREGAPSDWPKGTQTWYRGEDLFKVSVPLGKKAKKSAAAVAQAARMMEGLSAGGNVFLLDASADVPAERLIPVAANLGSAPGPEWPSAGVVYPGIACRTEEQPEPPAPGGEQDGGGAGEADAGARPQKAKADEKKAAEVVEAPPTNACPTHAVVLFPGVAIPNASGLTKEPVKKQVEAPPPKQEVKEEASAAFCNKGDIKRVMGGRAGAFKFCYERQLQQNPELEGKVVLRFEIDRNGDPRKVAVASSTLKNDSVHDCLKANVKKLMFEKPDGGICAVQWPLVFKN